MPEKILELLETCSLTKEQIAEKINVTLEELDAAMEYLQQMGYIKSTAITPFQLLIIIFAFFVDLIPEGN